MICKKCGTSLQPNDRFCYACGAPIEPPTPTPTVAAPPEPPVSAAVVPPIPSPTPAPAVTPVVETPTPNTATTNSAAAASSTAAVPPVAANPLQATIAQPAVAVKPSKRNRILGFLSIGIGCLIIIGILCYLFSNNGYRSAVKECGMG